MWEPPPLRYPKGRGRSRQKAADVGPLDGVDAPDELQRLVQLASGRSAEPSLAAKSLPGEGLYLYLEDLRAVQLQASGKAGPWSFRLPTSLRRCFLPLVVSLLDECPCPPVCQSAAQGTSFWREHT